MGCFRAAVFDMDGTILNTGEDLRDSLNYALSRTGHRCDYDTAQVGSFFGSGALVAVVRALCTEQGAAPEALERVGTPGDGSMARFGPAAEEVMAVFRDWYPRHCEIFTRPYEGIPELLRRLREAGIRTAVVSNKLDAAVQSLCARHFPGLFDAALGEREPERRRKPHPDMALEALKRMGVPPEAAVCVGDTEIDLQTARNAGTACVSVAWGCRTRDFLTARGAKTIVDSVEELERSLIRN